jgi:hypothetical protein
MLSAVIRSALVESLIKERDVVSCLQYAALSVLRRLPLDPRNPTFLHRDILGPLLSSA